MYREAYNKLRQQRERVWTEYRDALESYEEATADSETRQRFDRMDKELTEYDRRLKIAGDEAAREATISAGRNPFVYGLAGAAKHVSEETRAFEAWCRFGGASNARHINTRGLAFNQGAYESRVLGVTSQSAGGALVPTEFSPLLYRYLIQNSALRQTNVRVVQTDTGDNYVQPSFDAYSSEATIVTAGGTIGADDPAFEGATLSAYKFGTLWQIQYELLQDSAYDLLNELAFQFGRALANGEGKAFLLGAVGGPAGILPNCGTVYQYVGGTPAANGPTYLDLVSLQHEVIPPYRQNSFWMLNDHTLEKIRKLEDNNGRPLWTSSLSGFGQDVPDQIMGKPYVIDPYMPDVGVGATAIVYGDFSGVTIREVAGMRLERSDDYAFNQDLVTFRILHRADAALVDTHGALATYKGGTA